MIACTVLHLLHTRRSPFIPTAATVSSVPLVQAYKTGNRLLRHILRVAGGGNRNVVKPFPVLQDTGSRYINHYDLHGIKSTAFVVYHQTSLLLGI